MAEFELTYRISVKAENPSDAERAVENALDYWQGDANSIVLRYDLLDSEEIEDEE